MATLHKGHGTKELDDVGAVEAGRFRTDPCLDGLSASNIVRGVDALSDFMAGVDT